MTRFDALPKGQRIAERFVIDRPLGRGRSSAVYAAIDLHTRTTVALKILDPFLSQDPVGLERFRREAAVLRSLQHPHIVKVFSFFKDGDLWVICMEYVDGVDGKTAVARNGPLSVRALLPLALRMAGALEACHARGVLHRDLKPHNILLTPEGEVKLVDFGVSRINTMSDLTKTGTIIGTPEYMAPELFESTQVDPRADVYALGAVLYELLTGRPPFPAGSLAAIMARQARDQIEPVTALRQDVPAWLEQVILKCLQSRRERRYQSCAELRADLERKERARALTDAAAPPRTCLQCKTELIRGLVFCHGCGRFSAEVYARGPQALILYACDDKRGLQRHLRRSFPDVAPADMERSLANLPAPLVRGVSEETASSLANELSAFPCELRVATSLPSELRLPRTYVLLGLVPLLAMWLTGPHLPLLFRIGLVLFSELILLALYWDKTRPIISLDKLRRTTSARADPRVVARAARLRELSDANLKHILARATAGELAARRRLERSTAILDPEAIGRAVDAAFDAAVAIERYSAYLGSRSLNDIKEKLTAVDARLRDAGSTAAADGLIAAKTKLQRDFANYQEIQDLHGRLSVSVFTLAAVLQRIEDSLGDEAALREARSELEALREQLAVGDADAALTAA